jgi:hypothetical protein
MAPAKESSKEQLKWTDLPVGFQSLLKRSYAEYNEILYDPYLHPRARKVPSWDDWLAKHDIIQDSPPDCDTELIPPSIHR